MIKLLPFFKTEEERLLTLVSCALRDNVDRSCLLNTMRGPNVLAKDSAVHPLPSAARASRVTILARFSAMTETAIMST